MSTTTTHAGRSFRPGRTIFVGLAWRAALVVVAAIAVALEAPAVVRAPLSTAAAVVVIVWYVQRARRRGAMDTWLIATGVSIALLTLLGLLLNLLPFGLSAAGWALAIGVLQLAVLVVLAFVRPPIDRVRMSRRPTLPAVGWGVAVVAVLGGAVVWSAISFQQTHVLPVALEARSIGRSFTVTVTSGASDGPYRIDLVTDSGRTVLARGVRVGPGRVATTTVTLPQGDRGLVQLVPEGAASPVRELILDRTRAASAS